MPTSLGMDTGSSAARTPCPRCELQKLVDQSGEHDVWLVTDEVVKLLLEAETHAVLNDVQERIRPLFDYPASYAEARQALRNNIERHRKLFELIRSHAEPDRPRMTLPYEQRDELFRMLVVEFVCSYEVECRLKSTATIGKCLLELLRLGWKYPPGFLAALDDMFARTRASLAVNN